MPRTIEIVSLVYRSTAYVDFCVGQLQRFGRLDDPAAARDWQVSFRLVANDATPDVLRRLVELRDSIGLRFDIFNAPSIDEYYINRVYRAWNFAMLSSTANVLCFSGGSDMAYSPGWLDALLRHYDGVNIPCSRLVENGYLGGGENASVFRENKHVAFGNFGSHPSEFRQDDWLIAAAGLQEQGRGRTEPGGFYAGWLIDRERFIKSGGLPNGNVYKHGVGRVITRRRNPSKLLCSGDAWFFREVLEKQFGMRHITVFDSVLYHIKEGEMRDRKGECSK